MKTSKTPKQVIESFWTAFAAGKLADAFAHHMTGDCEMLMPGAPPLKGEQQIRAMFEAWTRALPDFRAETLHAIEDGDTYAAETRFAGTHRGPMVTPQGELPPTGNAVTWTSADVVRVRDGKICSWHIYHDPIPLLAQLGASRG